MKIKKPVKSKITFIEVEELNKLQGNVERNITTNTFVEITLRYFKVLCHKTPVAFDKRTKSIFISWKPTKFLFPRRYKKLKNCNECPIKEIHTRAVEYLSHRPGLLDSKKLAVHLCREMDL